MTPSASPAITHTDPVGNPITNSHKTPLPAFPRVWSYWMKKEETPGGELISLSRFLEKRLAEFFSGNIFVQGDRGCEFANPVCVYLLQAVAEWTGSLGETILIEIPVAQSAICKARNENGVVGHCPVPMSVREWLKRFHAGECPAFVAPGM